MNDAVAQTANEIVPTRRREEAFTFVCECGRVECRERVLLGREEYDEVRVHRHQRVIAGSHRAPAVERVVADHERYTVVENRADALRSVA